MVKYKYNVGDKLGPYEIILIQQLGAGKGIFECPLCHSSFQAEYCDIISGRHRSCGCGHTRIKDLTGQKFGRLTVVKFTGELTDSYNALWLCECDCGNSIIISADKLTGGKKQSCGCLRVDNAIKTAQSNLLNLDGQKFGRLLALYRIQKDNKYYYLTSQNNVTQYSEVTATDNSYYIYDLLLKGDDVIKVVTGDSSTGLYYVLKTDGNVYGYIVTQADRNSPPAITSSTIAYNQEDYGGKIIDFNYAGNSTNTFVKTNNKIYRMYVSNGENCSKYADVTCTYEMKEDKTLNEYSDRIIVYNGNTLITDYHRIFTVNN